MSLINIGMGLIFLSIALRLGAKHTKGHSLSKIEKATLIVTVIGVMIEFTVLLLSIISSNFQITIPAFVRYGFLIVFPLVLVGWHYFRGIQRKKETTIDPRFAHLTIHYSQRTDTPETTKPARPHYIVNNVTNQAYWGSDLIEPYIKQHRIPWHTHDGARAVSTYFEQSEITVNETPPLPKDLGLRFNENNVLIKKLEAPQIVTKLNGRRLNDLEVEWLFPWYYHFLPAHRRNSPPDKRVLLKISTNEAFGPPDYDIELFRHGIFGHQNYIMRPLETPRKWCKRKGYDHQNRQYTEDELLADYKKRFPEVEP